MLYDHGVIRAASLLVPLALISLLVLGACGDDDPQAVNVASAGSTRTVVCGKATCRGDDFCCGSDGWADATCAPSCETGKNPIFCDEASDCQQGSQCCFILKNGNSIVESFCATTCAKTTDRGQLCSATTKDCDGTCTPIDISPSGLSQCVSK